MKYSYLIAIFILLSLIIACKPTVKNETYKFDRNQQKIIELKNNYPRFKVYLEDIAKKAEKIYNESHSIADEEDKVKKMIEANNAFSRDQLFSELNNYDRLCLNINNIKGELRLIIDQKYSQAIRDILDYSIYNEAEAADILKYSRPTNYNDALGDIDRANKILIEVEDLLNKTMKAINEDKNKATADNPGNNDPRMDTNQDSGGREAPDSDTSDYGGREEPSTTEKEDLGGRG